MASNVPSSFPDPFTNNHHESPFTSTDIDMLPPLPNLLPDDPSQLVEYPDNEIMLKYAQLQKENEQLKAELAEIRSQRTGEQNAYGDLIKSVEILITQLSPQAKTPAMRLALQNLVNTNQAYRNQAVALNQYYDQIQGVLPKSSPQGIVSQPLYPASPTRTPPSLKRRFSQDPTSTYSPQPPTSRLRHENAITAIKTTLAQLQLSRPHDSQSFEVALAHLKNNISSFAPFIVVYLNGRYKHVTAKLRPQVYEEIGGFFDDPGDAKLIVSNVMKVLRENVKYVEQDVQGIGSDIIGPVGMVLWSLVGLLEQDKC